MTVSDATSLIVAKAKEAPIWYQEKSQAAAMYWATNALWSAEYASWRAIVDSSLGPLSPAARCAWERRTAYSDASGLLAAAW